MVDGRGENRNFGLNASIKPGSKENRLNSISIKVQFQTLKRNIIRSLNILRSFRDQLV
jgi:hypothetical protein